MRLLAGLAVALVLAGCGTVGGRSGAPASGLAAAPPLEALDEAPPPDLQQMLDSIFAPLPADFGKPSAGTGTLSQEYVWGVDSASGGTQTTSTTPTPEQLAQLKAQMEAEREALQPAAGSPPRVVARLALVDGQALLAAWRNRDGLLCTVTQVRRGDSGGGSGPEGPCTRSTAPGTTEPPPCAAICLTSDSDGPPGDQRWLLQGTVASDADELSVTTDDGTTTTYPLAGPELGDRRVFMLDLGAHDWRKLALLRGGEVVAQAELPAFQVAIERCNAKVGPAPMSSPAAGSTEPPPGMQSWSAAMNACLRASGALP